MDQIWANAMHYNKEETHYYITAAKLKNRLNRLIKPIFEEEERLLSHQTIKALRVLLPPNFWNIDFSLSEPLTCPYSIDEYSLEDLEAQLKTLSLPIEEETSSESGENLKIIEEEEEESAEDKTETIVIPSDEENVSSKSDNEKIPTTPKLHDISIEKEEQSKKKTTSKLSLTPTLPFHRKDKISNVPSLSLSNGKMDKNNKKMIKDHTKNKDTPMNIYYR